jgi:hypothetical protein
MAYPLLAIFDDRKNPANLEHKVQERRSFASVLLQ